MRQVVLAQVGARCLELVGEDPSDDTHFAIFPNISLTLTFMLTLNLTRTLWSLCCHHCVMARSLKEGPHLPYNA